MIMKLKIRHILYLMSPDDDSASAVSDSLSGMRNSRTPEVDSSLATAASVRTKLVGATGLKAIWRIPKEEHQSG